jgi:hypothetical protein
VTAHPSRAGAWIAAESGLYREDQGVFHPVNGVPSGTIYLADQDHLWIGGSDGLFRARIGRDPEVIGLREGQLLLEPISIGINVAKQETAQSIAVTLDDVPLPFAETLSLDPAQLEDGAHVLSITVTYADGDASVQVRFTTFRMGPPTWSTDIAPLFEQRCAMCHASGGVAHLLDDRQLWIDEIDLILLALREARMPLPPNPRLASLEIDRIDGWRAGGFLE